MEKPKFHEAEGVGRVSRVVGRNVRAMRSALKLSQEELAFRAGLDRTYISQIERGIGNPSILVMAKIAEALRAALSEVFSDD